MAMAVKSALVVAAVVLLAMAATSSAAVYTVGDTSGWTILGNVNYADWAGKKTFHVGDIIEFKYPAGMHNVLEVKKADYDSCTNSTPIATHTSGDDKVTIKGPGHRFFICGVPGHCAAGQKLNVRVLKPRSTRSSRAPSPAPAASAPVPTPVPAAVPAPAPATESHADGDASTPPAAASSTDRGSSSSATAHAPAPNANGAAGVSAGYPAVLAAVALAVVASMAVL